MTIEQARNLAISYYHAIFIDAAVHDGYKVMCQAFSITEKKAFDKFKEEDPNARIFSVTKRYDKFAEMLVADTIPKDILKIFNAMPKIDQKMSIEIRRNKDAVAKFLKDYKKLIEFKVE